MSTMLMLLQAQAEGQQTQGQQIEIAQEVVIAIIAATTIMVVVLLLLIWSFSRHRPSSPSDQGPLRYGNFFVVIFGIMTVLIAFLVAFPLVISRVFEDPTQVIALLSALFGTIVGLVGTYFGVKSSSDAGDRAQQAVETITTSRLGPPNVGPGGGSNGGGQGNGGQGGSGPGGAAVGGQGAGQQQEANVTSQAAGAGAGAQPRNT